MNYKNEPYPEDVFGLMRRAEKLAEEVRAQLNRPDCPRIEDLYEERNGKRVRNLNRYGALQLAPNSYLTDKSRDKGKTPDEFKGLYIMGEENECGIIVPVNVGISRTIFRRIRQHGWGKTHYLATLAYMKTSHWAKQNGAPINREMVDDDALEPARSMIRNYKVTFVPVENDYELYFLEVALAGLFRTKWNSFKTH